MEQPAGKLPRHRTHNGALPGLKLDRPHMLASWPVLGKQARPVPRAARDLDAAGLLPDGDLVVGPDGAHGSLALPDEPRPGVRARDAQFPHLLVSRASPAYAAVAQIEAKQIGVVGPRFRESGVFCAPGTGGTVQCLFRVLAPIAQC